MKAQCFLVDLLPWGWGRGSTKEQSRTSDRELEV